MIWIFVIIYIVSAALTIAEFIREGSRVSVGETIMVFVPGINTIVGMWFIIMTILENTKKLINFCVDKGKTEKATTNEDSESGAVL